MSMWELFAKHPITRIMAFIALFIGFTILLTIVAVSALSSVVHVTMGLMIKISLVAEALAAILAFCFMVRLVDKRSLASAGLTVRGLATETTTGYLIGIAILSIVIGIMATLGVYHVMGRNPGFRPLLPLALFLCAGAAEEIVFRGYIFQTLEARWGSRIAIIFSSLLFGLVHLANPGSHVSTWQFLAGPAFICVEAGLPLAAGYMATRRLWLPIGLHWAWDFFEGPIYGSNVSGVSFGTLYQARIAGPFYLTGGAFGPEASVIALIVGFIAGLLLLRVAVRAGQWKSGEQPIPASGVTHSDGSEPPR